MGLILFDKFTQNSNCLALFTELTVGDAQGKLGIRDQIALRVVVDESLKSDDGIFYIPAGGQFMAPGEHFYFVFVFLIVR